MRSLAADDGRPSVAGVLVAAAVLGLWTAWLTLGRVSVYEQSASARVEVDRAVHPLDSTAAGRVVRTRLALGQRVEAGDVLVEIDTRAQELERVETLARLQAIEPQLVALRNQRDVLQRSLRDAHGETGATLQAARARLAEARTLAALADDEARRAERLRELGHGAAADAERARATARSRHEAARALELDLRRMSLEGASRESTRRTDLARIEGDVARLEGERTTLRASLERLADTTARRLVRAPVAGTIGSVAEIREGSVVTEGQRLATIVPSGELRVVAEFPPPTALGRIRQGQRGRLRLDGFPWAQWGTVATVVRRVGTEAREGNVRVELALTAGANTRIPLEHGLPGNVEVEVERVAPGVLILRSAGQLLTGSSSNSTGTSDARPAAQATAATSSTSAP